MDGPERHDVDDQLVAFVGHEHDDLEHVRGEVGADDEPAVERHLADRPAGCCRRRELEHEVPCSLAACSEVRPYHALKRPSGYHPCDGRGAALGSDRAA